MNTTNLNSNTNVKSISKLYNNLTFFDQYGSSFYFMILLIVCLLMILAYCYILANMQTIKNDWINQRCKPYILPFAGMINTPKDKTMTEFTSENFTYCSQTILQTISSDMLKPLTFITNFLGETVVAVSDALNMARAMMSKMRSFFQSMIQELMGRLMNVMVALQQIIIGVRDFLAKVQGTLAATLFTSLGTYYTLKALLGSIAEMILRILIALAAIISLLWIFPITWGAAAANTAIFVALSIPLALILSFFMEVLQIHPSLAMPGVPTSMKCFDKDTKFLVFPKDKTNSCFPRNKTAETVLAGDWLGQENNLVTAKYIFSAEGVDMYYLKGTIVSGLHHVKYKCLKESLFYNKKKWIHVNAHPDAVLLTHYPPQRKIYCFSTSSKSIFCNDHFLFSPNTEFADWNDDHLQKDSTNEQNEQNEQNQQNEQNDNNENKKKDTMYHEDGGFYLSTEIILKEGTKKTIDQIQIGDVLENNAVVYGIAEVELSFLLINSVFNDFKGYNILPATKDKNENEHLFHFSKLIQTTESSSLYLRHLFTFPNSFFIDGIEVFDYSIYSSNESLQKIIL